MSANIFDYISDILFKKKKKFSNLSNEQLEFQPFMLQRWISMSNKDAVNILNETTNKWLMHLTDKNMLYCLLHEIIPAQRQKKVAYIKKAAKTSDTSLTKEISNTFELSEREIKENINLLNLISK